MGLEAFSCQAGAYLGGEIRGTRNPARPSGFPGLWKDKGQNCSLSRSLPVLHRRGLRGRLSRNFQQCASVVSFIIYPAALLQNTEHRVLQERCSYQERSKVQGLCSGLYFWLQAECQQYPCISQQLLFPFSKTPIHFLTCKTIASTLSPKENV